jgi:hypothetical protein
MLEPDFWRTREQDEAPVGSPGAPGRCQRSGMDWGAFRNQRTFPCQNSQVEGGLVIASWFLKLLWQEIPASLAWWCTPVISTVGRLRPVWATQRVCLRPPHTPQKRKKKRGNSGDTVKPHLPCSEKVLAFPERAPVGSGIWSFPGLVWVVGICRRVRLAQAKRDTLFEEYLMQKCYGCWLSGMAPAYQVKFPDFKHPVFLPSK